MKSHLRSPLVSRVSIMLALRSAAIAVLATSIAACATGPAVSGVDPGDFLHDDAFPEGAARVVESQDTIFRLDSAAKEFLDARMAGMDDGAQPDARTLLQNLVHHAALDVSYASDANATASEAFHDKAVNCLSMSILGYSMARHLGLEATFQEVDIPEYWERRNHFSLMTRHINLRLDAGSEKNAALKHDVEIDFLPFGDTWQHDRRTISQSRVLAMFYSNKGVDALLGKNRAEAYAYFKAALREDPSLDMAMTNLGLLYRLNGHLEWAEDAFRHAMRLNPDNTVNAESLAGLLRNTGRENEASVLQARLERERRYNPYYQYIQGEEAYDAGNWSQAVAHFKRAIRLEADASEFHYGLAKAYSALGDEDRANAAALIGEIRENDASGEERSRPCRPHRAYPAYYFLPC